MRTLALAATAFLALSAPALADEQTATAAPAALTKPDQKLICRWKTHQGMLIGKPVCMTKAHWELALYKAQHEVSDFQQRHYSR